MINEAIWTDLAIFGGSPQFSSPLHVGTPSIGDRQHFLRRLGLILDQRRLTNDGPYVREFEMQVACFLGVRHCVAVANGTLALQIMFRAAAIVGEVILPSFTFIATAHALTWEGFTPVFCDINPGTHCLDPRALEKLITPRTTSIIGVHTWGVPCDIAAIEEVADRYKLSLMFDASHAFGCSYRGRMIGGFGVAEAFSLHATKYVNAFEGGLITTNDDALAAKMRLMRNFGFAGYDNVVAVGINAKMSEVSAAMGLTNFESIDEFVAINRRNYLLYQEALQDIPGVYVHRLDSCEQRNYQYLIVEIDCSITNIERDDILRVLHAEGILARRYFYPGCHKAAPYLSSGPFTLRYTNELCNKVLVLPTGQTIGPGEIAQVCRCLRLITANSDAIRTHLRTFCSVQV